MTAVAWIVIDAKGHRAVFLDRPRADEYAARVHGVVRALYMAD